MLTFLWSNFKHWTLYWVHTYWLHHEPLKKGDVWFSSIRPHTYFVVCGLQWNKVYGVEESKTEVETFPIAVFQSMFHKERTGRYA